MPGPAGAMRPDIVFLDVESSGLYPGSYPVEVGICDDGLRPESWLVRTAPEWAGLPWTAEHVHGISRDDLRLGGLPAAGVADALNARLAGRLVVTDALAWDGFWVGRLFEAAGRDMAFVLRDEAEAFAALVPPAGDGDAAAVARDVLARFRSAEEASLALYPRTHRAGADALSVAARFRMMLDPAFLDACLAECGPDGVRRLT